MYKLDSRLKTWISLTTRKFGRLLAECKLQIRTVLSHEWSNGPVGQKPHIGQTRVTWG